MSELQRKVQLQALPPLPTLPSASNSISGRGGRGRRKQEDYTPLSWEEFFQEKRRVEVGARAFNVYTKGNEGILILLLHGGGYSGLTWSCFVEEIYGMVQCQIVAPDLRAHGDTVTENDDDVSADTMARDVGDIMLAMFGEVQPPTFLMGHSMGGAISVHTAAQGYVKNLIGLAVIDVVEGSAMDALSGMFNFLRCRPQSFKSTEKAVEWCVGSGTVRNVRSARISMPSQVRPNTTGPADSLVVGDTLEEEEEDHDFKTPKPPPESVCWRTDLFKTQPHWVSWFTELSSLFLSVSVPKLLILAGVDRLDKDLTVGQMQGKFQMIVLPKVGHAVQEDSPYKVAQVVASFCVRNKFCTATADFVPVMPGC